MAQTETPGASTTPMLYLEIVRGNTEFPNRPVFEGVFLIGSGSNCDLRLGGPETPAVHSILRAEAAGVHIESLSRKPALRVNGQPCERAELDNGDSVQIGSIRLVARFQAMPAVAVEAQEIVMDEDLTALNCEELLTLLEGDLALVEDHNARQAAGVERLVEAATSFEANGGTAGLEPLRIVDPDEELHDSHAEAEQLVVALNRIADDLNLRVDHLRKKEEVYAEAAEDLLAMQNRFASLLERVLARLESREGETHRRSA